MGMTITEKILAGHADLEEVKPGDLIFAKLDLVMATDVTTPLSAKVFKEMGAKDVFDKTRVALVNDHFVPAKDIQSAELSKAMRQFAHEFQIINYFEVGRSGICHTIVPDEGLAVAGDCIIGADSHTCTYGALGAFSTGVGSTDLSAALALGETWFRVPETIKVIYKGKLPEMIYGKDLILLLIGKIGIDGATYQALEFAGEVIEMLPMCDRFTIANMAIEAGAKNGIIAPDNITLEYMKGRAKREWKIYKSDPDAKYKQIIEFDVTNLEPQIACPFSPENVKPISEVEPVEVDQVVIGSCTNGRIEDFRVAVQVMQNRPVHPNVRMLIIPASQKIYKQMIEEGIAEKFVSAGAVISTSTCGPCIGGHMGVLASKERAFYTTNRNFYGRTGHVTAEVYLGSPAVAAATAVTGKITDPREFMN